MRPWLSTLCFFFALLSGAPALADDAVSENTLVQLINECRVRERLPALATHACLKESSSMKVDDMAAHGYFSHQSPRGEAFWTFVQRAHYRYDTAAEILARGAGTEREMVEAWMSSPAHRSAILDPRFKDINCSARSSGGTYYVVCHLGRSADKPLLPPSFRTAANTLR